MKPATPIKAAASLLLAIGLGGCGLEKATTGPEPTRFLKSTGTNMSEKMERLPFEHSWRSPKVDLTKYKYIVVRPVTTAFLKTDNWEDSKGPYVPNKRTFVRRANSLASYWTKSLNKAFSSPVCVFYKTTDTSQPGTLILEVALTQVTFDRRDLKKSTAPEPVGNVPGVFTGLPNCAFEARVRDAATGKLVSTAADHRGPAIQLVGAEPSKTTVRPTEQICDEWSQQLMMSSNTELFPTVRRSWLKLF